MTYNKPSVEVLGEAISSIQGNKPNVVHTDSAKTGIPAYDLDE